MTWLQAVPSRQREAVALCLYGAHSCREAADALALPAAQVAELLSTGMHELAAAHDETADGTP